MKEEFFSLKNMTMPNAASAGAVGFYASASVVLKQAYFGVAVPDAAIL
jgi:hypothetical protein